MKVECGGSASAATEGGGTTNHDGDGGIATATYSGEEIATDVDREGSPQNRNANREGGACTAAAGDGSNDTVGRHPEDAAPPLLLDGRIGLALAAAGAVPRRLAEERVGAGRVFCEGAVELWVLCRALLGHLDLSGERDCLAAAAADRGRDYARLGGAAPEEDDAAAAAAAAAGDGPQAVPCRRLAAGFCLFGAACSYSHAAGAAARWRDRWLAARLPPVRAAARPWAPALLAARRLTRHELTVVLLACDGRLVEEAARFHRFLRADAAGERRAFAAGHAPGAAAAAADAAVTEQRAIADLEDWMRERGARAGADAPRRNCAWLCAGAERGGGPPRFPGAFYDLQEAASLAEKRNYVPRSGAAGLLRCLGVAEPDHECNAEDLGRCAVKMAALGLSLGEERMAA